MTISNLISHNNIERVVYVPASDLLPRAEFHAWRFDNTMECGIGATVEEAIEDAARIGTRRAA